jgi:hypothetical protein
VGRVLSFHLASQVPSARFYPSEQDEFPTEPIIVGKVRAAHGAQSPVQYKSTILGAAVHFLQCSRAEGVREVKMSRILIVLGVVLLAIGLLWRWIGRLGLGRLPGDIVIEHENFMFYVPITTGLLISAVLTLIFWLANR